MRTSAGPRVILDLSNLCRDRRMLQRGAKADFGLLDRFATGLECSDISFSSIHSVADKSLLALVDTDARRRLRELERAMTVEFSSIADERMLELAFGHGSAGTELVATRDSLDDFRRLYPTIQGNVDRFIVWSPREDGSLDVIHRDMGVHDHVRISWKEESAELKERRLRRISVLQRARERHYTCVNSECLLAQLWPDRLPELPRYDDRTDQFVCPACESPVTAGEPRPDAAQFIVFLEGVEQFRFMVDEGTEIQVGRSDRSGVVGLEHRVPPGAARAVSRQHVAFRHRGGRVEVEELGSRNGTALRSRNEDTEEIQLAAGQSISITRAHTVALPAGITIELSGRSIPLDDGVQDPSGKVDEGVQSARMITTGRRQV
jgi:hypothetical protein